MKNPLVSIIIPCYNAEPFLKRCIDSIICQSYSNWEAIVINDGSFDKTLSVCHDLVIRDKRIIVVDKKINEGVSLARRTGFHASNGEWIMFVDADDTLPIDAVQNYVDAISPTNDIIVGSTSDWIMKDYMYPISYYIKHTIIQQSFPSAPWCHFFRATLFSDFAFDTIPIKKGQDLLMNIRLAFNTSKDVKTISKVSYNYMYNPQSTVHTFVTNMDYEFLYHQYKVASIPSNLMDEYHPAVTLSMLSCIKKVAKRNKNDVSWIGHPFHKQLMASIKYSHFPLTYLEMCWLTVTNKATRRLIDLGLRIDRKLRDAKYDHTLHI